MTEGKPPRVLVADDEDAIRTLVSRMLTRAGFAPVAAKERLHHLCCIISKPFDMEELIQVVRDCTRR